jgi:hypothetical protein
MDILPGPHANVLIFLMSFIRQILEWPVFIQNAEAKRRTGRICRWIVANCSTGVCQGVDSKSNEL